MPKLLVLFLVSFQIFASSPEISLKVLDSDKIGGIVGTDEECMLFLQSTSDFMKKGSVNFGLKSVDFSFKESEYKTNPEVMSNEVKYFLDTKKGRVVLTGSGGLIGREYQVSIHSVSLSNEEQSFSCQL